MLIPFEPLVSKSWTDYKLLDSGNHLKWEQFGQHRTIRPEPQAFWKPSHDFTHWQKNCDLIYEATSSTAGKWKVPKGFPDSWTLDYTSGGLKLSFELRLSSFKHVGVFPEQAAHWDWIYQECKKRERPRVLNLFAYTGGSSLAASAGGADVFHVDSVKSILTWANRNRELSKLENIHWIAEDAFKFVQRELRRGKSYDGIILDPPAYGIGPKGERWKLENLLGPMIHHLKGLLRSEGFLLLNTYSLNLSPYTLAGLFQQEKFEPQKLKVGELLLSSVEGPYLPLGAYLKLQ